MTAEVGPNFICRPYRGLSVDDVTIALDADSVREYLLGRPVYRRTEFVVLVADGRRCVAQVEKASLEPLFSPVTSVRYLFGPDEVAFVDDDAVDTGNATQMAGAALSLAGERPATVVQGRFQHVNLIVSPQPLHVRVVEVVPPEPPKLYEMARAVLDFDEDLPPIVLDLETVDLRSPDGEPRADGYLFPCRSSGLELDAPVRFLDSGPPELLDWTLVGCERSRQIHEFFYGQDPPARVELCPKRLVPPGGGTTLLKCCLLERGLEHTPDRAVVPWGASLDEVRAALRLLAGLPESDREGR